MPVTTVRSINKMIQEMMRYGRSVYVTHPFRHGEMLRIGRARSKRNIGCAVIEVQSIASGNWFTVESWMKFEDR